MKLDFSTAGFPIRSTTSSTPSPSMSPMASLSSCPRCTVKSTSRVRCRSSGFWSGRFRSFPAAGVSAFFRSLASLTAEGFPAIFWAAGPSPFPLPAVWAKVRRSCTGAAAARTGRQRLPARARLSMIFFRIGCSMVYPHLSFPASFYLSLYYRFSFSSAF